MEESAIDGERRLNIYCIALPEPVGIQQNVTLHFVYDERNTPYLKTPTINISPSDLLCRVGAMDDVVIKFTHVPTAPSDFLIRSAAAVAVFGHVTGETDAAKAVDPRQFIEDSGDKFKPSKIVSVAEVAVFDTVSAQTAPRETEIEDLTDPLLRALHCLQHLVRAYNLTAERPAAIPRYQRVGPKVPHARRLLRPGSAWEKFLQPLDHDNIADRPPKLLGPEKLAQILDNVQLLSAADPRSIYYETFMQAQCLALRDGEYSSAILRSAQACEVLFDGILGLLLWEELGGAPHADGPVDKAAEIFSNDLRPRLKNAYHPLLGGRWNLTEKGTLSDWSELVATPRNRIVHRGYQPRADEAAEALNATQALDDFITGLVAARAKRFPRTALMWVTEQGLMDAGKWPLVRAFARERQRSEPPWRDNYASWRQRVDATITPRRRKKSQ
ncbi:hypothetical protein [Mycobacterium seoulense]|nr:hypothetical protein [Mycobacterium seoulense]MCV7436531.1 hypothetical protein [Mycobacterium seoulense]